MLRSPAPTAFAILLAVPLWLVACDEGTDLRNGASANHAAGNEAADVAPAPVDHAAPIPAANVASVDSPAVSAPAEAMKGETGARAVLLNWARALERRDWATARAQWGHDGADSGMDAAAFAQAYEKYATITVAFGEAEVEGGAGSLYYEAPVTIAGTLKDGRPYRLEGPVTLRRVNDVDGATAQELAWHIGQSALTPRP